jgi:hypothetical protein
MSYRTLIRALVSVVQRAAATHQPPGGMRESRSFREGPMPRQSFARGAGLNIITCN